MYEIYKSGLKDCNLKDRKWLYFNYAVLGEYFNDKWFFYSEPVRWSFGNRKPDETLTKDEFVAKYFVELL